MLNVLRKSATTWVGIPILVVAVGAMVFTLFQPQGPLVRQQGDSSIVATIGKTAISDSEYSDAIQRTVVQEERQNPGLTVATFLRAGGGEAILSQLIEGQALDVFGRRHGMVISKRLVDGELASIPAFQLNGRFDEATFRQVLADQRISEAELRQSIGFDLIRRQLLQPLLTGVTVPDAMAKGYAKLLLEQRQGVVISVPRAAMPDPGDPEDADLEAFYNARKASYTIPERRGFRFALLDGSTSAAKAAPTAAEVRQYYDQHPAEFGGVETRDAYQIVLPDEKTAQAFVAAVRGGRDFLTAAKERGFNREDVFLGRLDEEALGKSIGNEAAHALFVLSASGVSDPAQTSFGWRVLHVGTIAPAKARPFAAVAGAIEKQLRDQKAKDLLSAAVASATDALEDGQSLADVAKNNGAAVQQIPPLTKDGRLFDADYKETEVSQPLLAQAFEADQADGPQVVGYGDDRYALLEVTDVVPPTLEPLAAIRDRVVQAWKASRQLAAAKDVADRVAKELSGGAAIAAATKGANLPPPQQLRVRRLELAQMAQQGQNVPPAVLTLLDAPEGQARVIPVPGGEGWFIVKVDRVTPGDDKQAEPLAAAARTSLAQEASNEFAARFVEAVEREVKVKREEKAIAAVHARLSGTPGDDE